MRKLLASVTGVVVSTAVLAATAGAVTRATSGDTCVVNGNGTHYTVVITLASTSPEQGGFAFGVPGAKVTGVKITGGTTTQTLAPKTTAGLLLSAGAVPGASITASLSTSSAVTGSFTVVPMDLQHAYLDAISCAFPQGGITPSNKFTVGRFPYSSTTGTWHSVVIVPSAGKVNFNQKATAANMAKPLVQSGHISAYGAGKVTLTLKPTAAGKAALAKSGSIKLNLSVEFSPKNGKPGNKIIFLTLKK
jgi:hypothetical protein